MHSRVQHLAMLPGVIVVLPLDTTYADTSKVPITLKFLLMLDEADNSIRGPFGIEARSLALLVV